ncbi:15274_t:CDS:2, partial [Racocetra persica]
NENKFLLKEKNECDKTDLNNQQIINKNKNLKEKDFENKISELRQEIHGVKKELSGFIKHNNLEKEKIRIDESLDNFKIIYNETDSIETIGKNNLKNGKKQANEIEEQLKECEKFKKEVEDKITEIMITHLDI